VFKKNVAVVGFGIGHFINATTGAAVTTGTPTCKRTIDGTGGACANAAAYNTDGAIWEIDLEAADMNGDVIDLSFTLTDCVPISYTIRTVTGIPDASGHYPADIIEAAGTAWGSGAITANSIAGDAITAAKIADDAISSEHINTGALTADAFAADAIVAATLATGAITADAFAADAIVAATLATGVLTADAFAADAIVAATLATGALTADAFAANAITNAAVADDVDVNVKTFTAGAITAAAFAAGAIDAAAIKDAAIDSATFAAGALDAVWSTAARTLTAIDEDATTLDLDATIAAAVWDAVIASYADVGSTGAALAAAGGSGDPWSTAVPGAYGAGTAGYVLGTTLPAEHDVTQAAIAAIGSGTGAAVNIEITGDNTSAPLKSVTFVGGQTGTWENLKADDTSTHVIASAANAIDIVYELTASTGQSCQQVIFKGQLTAGPDTFTFQAYRFDTSAWETRFAVANTVSAVQTLTIELFPRHTGSGADAGKVYIRILFSEGDAGTITGNMLLGKGFQTGSLTGYVDGIEVDTVDGTAGVVPYTNGTKDNPVLTWADALTIAGLTSINEFKFHGGSEITLSADSTSYEFRGEAWTLILNGKTIANAYINGAMLSGTGLGDGARFDRCCFTGEVTLSGSCRTRECGLFTTINLVATKKYNFIDCYDGDASTTSNPTLAFPGSGDVSVALRNYPGGIEVTGMVTGDVLTCNGTGGRIVIAASCTGGTITLRGNWSYTNNGTATVVETERYSYSQITSAATAATPTVTLADGAITDAKLAGGLEKVFETDFGTNYNSTAKMWYSVLGNKAHGGAVATMTLATQTISTLEVSDSASFYSWAVGGVNAYPLRTDDTGDNTVLRKGSGTVTGTTLATAAELAKVPKSDGAVIWNDTARAVIQTEANDALTAFTGDTGITLAKALEMLAAFMAGEVTATTDGTVTTYTYKKRDGSTTSFTSACTEADGTRATTGSLS